MNISEKVNNEPIKIMHVIGVLAMTGMEYGVIKQINKLDKNAFSPMVCCLRSKLKEVDSVIDSKIPIFELNKQPGRDFGIIFKLVSIFRTQQVDIVYSHNWETYFYSVLAALIARVPVTIHGEHGFEDPKIPFRQLLIKRLLAGMVTKLTSVSNDIARNIITNWNVSAVKVMTIPNGVNLEKFDNNYDLSSLRKEYKLTEKNKVVLNIGALRPVKDQKTLIKAFAQAYKDHNEARLLIVGEDYGHSLRSELEKMILDLGIEHAVFFTGLRYDIPQLLLLCDVYINCSLFEGMSNTILEAMAAGCPVIASNVGGNPELVDNKETGFLFPARNHVDLAKYMSQLFSDKHMACKMGSRGKEKVANWHSMPTMINQYSDLYFELLTRKKRRKLPNQREIRKKILARGIKGSGLLKLKELTNGKKLTIITYHRVLPLHDSDKYPFRAMVMPRDLFESQIAYLAKNYNVLDFSDAVERFKTRNLPDRAVVVTFDDGYIDNYKYAFPILKKYQMPAMFFVVSRILNEKMKLWWDEVAHIIMSISKEEAFDLAPMEKVSSRAYNILKKLEEVKTVDPIILQIVSLMNNSSKVDRDNILSTLKELDVTLTEKSNPDIMMSVEMLKEMKKSGMSIGAHTVTHAFLDELDDDSIIWEVKQSIEDLEKWLDSPICFFSYPRGRFSKNVRNKIENMMIKAAVTTVLGLNSLGDDLLLLKRIDAGFYRTNNSFDPVLFDTELHGWFDLLRKERKCVE